jgi:hypothetical protein
MATAPQQEPTMPFNVMIIPVTLFVCIATTVILVPIARAYARRMDRGASDPRLPHDLTNRLERMEQAIDSIAIEVERIAEGQRFTTKLLAERAKADETLPERAS